MTRLALLRIANLPFETLAALSEPAVSAAAAALVALDAEIARDAGTLADRLFECAGSAPDDAARATSRFSILRVRRDLHNGRTPRQRDLDDARPMLTNDLIAALGRHVERLDDRRAAMATYKEAHGAALTQARRELLRLAALPLVEHGIYLASRSLLPKVKRLSSLDPSDWSHDARHTAAKVTAYVTRFATKTSPNGVFCSVALAHIGGTTASIGGVAAIDHVDVLLSIAECRKVSAVLAIDPAVEHAVVTRINPTLRRDGDGALTFWKPASPRNPTDAEVFARVKVQPVLEAFLESANGASGPAALIASVAARLGRDAEELRPFYGLLVEKGILIGEVEIPYSSRRRLRDLAAEASRSGCEAPWISKIEGIERAIDDVAAAPLERRNGALERVVDEAAKLPRARPFKPDELFRVDAASALDVRLPGPVLDELSRGVRVLVRLLAGMFPDAAPHRRLIARFLESHPADVDVPFLALYRGFTAEADPGSEVAREFPKPADAPPADPESHEAWACARRVWDWFTSRAGGESRVVAIDEPAAHALVPEIPEPRWAAGALFQIAAESSADIEAGRYAIVLNGLFNGIGLALSRFAHLLGDEIVVELRRAWSAMARPGAILAEITYNHEARTANAGLRPILFSHEIELPGDLGSPGVEHISLGDLTIRYDSSRDRLVLRSISRDVEVIPVLSSGVSPSGIVSDLIHIGRQGWQTVGYLPGFSAPGIMSWPRFVCGRVVLFRARWIFGAGRVPAVERGDADFFLELTRWRRAHRLPRRVFAHTRTESKPFYVDLDSPVLTDLLRRAIAADRANAEPTLYLTEMLPGPDQLWIKGGEGSYASEFLVQLGSSS